MIKGLSNLPGKVHFNNNDKNVQSNDVRHNTKFIKENGNDYTGKN